MKTFDHATTIEWSTCIYCNVKEVLQYSKSNAKVERQVHYRMNANS